MRLNGKGHKVDSLLRPRAGILTRYNTHILYSMYFIRVFFSVSIKLHGSYDRNSDGLNDLISGSIDILLYFQDSSIAKEHLDSLLSLSATKVYQPLLITPYDCSLERSINGSHKTDFLESLTGFRPDVWIITMTSLIIIAMLINMHMKINQVSKPWMNPNGGFWTNISFLLKNPSMIQINWVSSILGTLVAIFALLVGKCYFENIIKSDQISIYQPTVYTSYATIAGDPRIQVYIYSPQFKTFCEQEPPHTKYKKIFDNNVKKHGMDKISPMEFANLFFSTPRDNKALIHSHEPGFGATFCNWKQSDLEHWNFDGLCIYEHILEYGDPERDDVEILFENQANLISLNFTRKKIFKRFLTFFNHAYEMGMKSEGIKGQGLELITPSVADCVPQKPPVTHDRGSLPFDLYNYKFSFALIVLLGSIALFILMFEIWYHRHYSSDDKSRKVIEISVHWKKSNENHSSLASTVQSMECRDDFVRNLTQSGANKKSKPTDVKSGYNSETERHRSKIFTSESNGIKTVPTRLNHTKKMVTHVDVHSSPSTSQGVSSGEKIKKKFGKNRIVPVFDDRILTEETQTCKK